MPHIPSIPSLNVTDALHRRRVVVLTFIIGGLLSLIGFGMSRAVYHRQRAEHQARLLERWKHDYASTQRYHDSLASFIMESLVQDPELTAHLANLSSTPIEQRAEPRAQLQAACEKLYGNLSRRGLRQLHFHSPDNVSLLRMHRPELHDDSLAGVRPTVEAANRTLRPVIAFEEGRIFNGFRYVFPVFHKGQHIGSVETSFSAQSFTDHLRESYPSRKYVFLLRSDVVAATVFEDARSFYEPFKYHPDYVVERGATLGLGAYLDLFGTIPADLNAALANNEAEMRPFVVANESWQLLSQPVVNYEGKPVARLVGLASDAELNRLRTNHAETVPLVCLGAFALGGLTALVIQFRAGLNRAKADAGEQLRKLAGHLPGMLYQFQHDPTTGRNWFPYTTDGIRDIYGIEPEAVSHDATPVLRCIYPDDRARVETSITDSAARLLDWHCEYRVILPGAARPVWREGRSTPERLPDGTILWHGFITDIDARKTAEAMIERANADLASALAESRLLSLVARRTSNAVAITNRRRQITWINEGFTRLTGYTLDEVIGQVPGRLLQCAESDPATISEIRAALAADLPYHGEIINRAKDGRIYWVELDISPLRDDAGDISGYMALNLDISARKAAESALRDEAERTQLALASGELGFWDWDVETDHVVFDARWAAMLGEDLSAITPHLSEWERRCHPDDLPAVRAALAEHLAGHTKIYQSLHRMRHRDGSWRWIQDTGRVFGRTADGRPRRVVGTHADVTVRHRAALERERLVSALAHTGRLAKVGAWELDLESKELFWSPEVRVLHEVDSDFTPTVENAVAFYPGTAGERIAEAVRIAMTEGRSYDIQLPLVTARGRSIWVRSMGEAVRVGGRIAALRGAFQDITEEHEQREALGRARDAAEAATRAKADFLANMSHEIRTPMNAVIGMSELLQTTPLTPEQADFVSTIRTSSDALLALINDILDFSKMDAGHLKLETVPVDLRACLEEALDLNARAAAIKHLDLMGAIDPDVPSAILGDVTRLRQVLTNLINNAVKFTATGEVLASISVVRPPGASLPLLRFAVRDTGIGIPTDRRDRLFHSFSQVDSSTTRQYGGTGLGLAICARIVQLMGGRIDVDSEPGRGSCFYFEVPFQATALPVARPVGPSPALAGRRLLIVDDNATNRRILEQQARDWGLLPATAVSGVEALAWLDRGDPLDVAVLDIQMPEMDGIELSRAIRLRRPALPLIALSSIGDLPSPEAATAFTRVLTKPAKSGLLRDALLAAIQSAPSSSPQATTSPAKSKKLADDHPLTLLVAEDVAINRQVARLMLGLLGYQTDLAANGLEALEASAARAYDVIFLDVQMPEMDGLTCARRLHELYPDQRRPWMIAMTANAMEGDRETCLAAGMDDYVSKPVGSASLAAALVRAAEGLRQRRPISPN